MMPVSMLKTSTFMVPLRVSRWLGSRVSEPDMSEAVAYCGTVSGRSQDKFADLQLTPTPGREVNAPTIEECVLHYECRTLHRNDMVPDALVQEIRDSAYAGGDYHRVYFGEIVATYADEDAAGRLREETG